MLRYRRKQILDYSYDLSKYVATLFWFPKIPEKKMDGYFVNVQNLNLKDNEIIFSKKFKKVVKPYYFFSPFDSLVIPAIRRLGGYIYCPYNNNNDTIKTLIIGKVKVDEKYSDATIRITKKYLGNDFKINLRPVISVKLNKFKKFYISFNIVR